MALMSAAVMAGPVQAATSVFDFSFLNAGTSVANGSFSYDTSKTGVLGYSDLDSFNVTLAGLSYDLNQAKNFTDYSYFGYDVANNNFVPSNPNTTCGFGGCGFQSVLSAINSDGSNGYFFSTNGFQEYSSQNLGAYDSIVFTQQSAGPGAPAPLVGVGLFPACAAFGTLIATRRRRRTVAV